MFDFLNRILGRSGQAQPIEDPESVLPEYYFVPRGRDEVVVAVGDEQRDQLLAKTQEKGVELEPVIPIEVDLGRPLGESNPVRFVVLSKSPRDAARVILKAKRMGAKSLRLPNPYDAELDIYDPNNPIGKEYLSLIGANFGEEQAGWAGNLWEGIKQASAKAGDAVRSAWGGVKDKARDAGEYIRSILPDLSWPGTKPGASPDNMDRPSPDSGNQPVLRVPDVAPAAPTPIIVPSPTASSRNVEKELAELSKESNRPSVPAPVGVTSQTQSSLAVIQQLDQRAKDEYLANILEATSKEEEAARLAAQIQKPKGVLGYLKLAKAALATGAGEYAKNLLAGISANLYGRDTEPPDQRARDAERRILSELQPYMTPQGGFDLARAYSDERRSYKPVPPEQKVQEEAQNIAFEQRAQQALREASQKLYEVGTSINKLVSDEDRALVSKVLSEPTTLKNLPDQIVAGFLSNIYYYLASALAMKLPNVAGPAAATGSIMLTEQGAKYDELIKELTKRGIPLDRAVEIAAAESFRYGVESGAVEQASNAAQLLTVIKALRSARNPSELARTLQKSPVKEFFKTLFKTVSTEAAEGGVQEWRSNVASERVEQRTGLEDLPKGDPLRAAFLEGISASPVGIVAASARGYAQHKANKINEQMSQPRPAESGAEEQVSPKTEETTDDQAAKTPTDEDAGRGDQKEAQSAAVDSSVAVDAKQESAEPAAKSAGVDVSVEPNIVNILEGEPGGISTWKPEEIERLTTALDYARTVADGVARQYQHVDPDDLYQELIGVSINASKKYQPGDVPFRSYLSVVFRNKIRDVLRASKRGAETRPLSLDAESEATGATIASTIPAPKREPKSTIEYLQDAVAQVIAEMPDGNDKAIAQGYLEGKSDEEIRKNVLKPDGTPYSREYVRQRKLQLIPELKKRARERAKELMARDEEETLVPPEIQQTAESDAVVAETGEAPPVMPRVSNDQIDAANRAIEEIRKKLPDVDVIVHWFEDQAPLYQQLVEMYKAAGKNDAEAESRAESHAKQFAARIGKPSEWKTIPAGAHHRGANIAFDKAAKRVEIWLLKNGKLPAGVDTVVHEIAESLSRDLVADPEHAAMIRENRARWTQWLENVAAKAEGKQKQRALEARSVLATERSLSDSEWLSRRFEDHWIQKWYSAAPNNTSAFKRLLNSFVQWAREYVEYLYARVLLYKQMADDGVLDQRLISVLESLGRERANRQSGDVNERGAGRSDRPYAVFAVARLPNGNIAATTRAADRGESGRIGLPGGKVAEGEDPIAALKREAMEEGWEIEVESDSPIHRAIVDGEPVWWYEAKPIRKLDEYKEKGRISPIEATVEQIGKSGYGNEFIPDYLSESRGPSYQAQRATADIIATGQHGRDYGTKLITGDAKLPPMQKRRVEDIAAIFEEETRRKNGSLQLDNMSNREIEDFADALERFVRASAELHPEARNWYRGTLSAAIDIAQRAHPELSQEEYRNVFIVLLSAFSNSEEVGRNWANAVTAYRLFRANNDAFVDIPTVARSAPISKLYSALESIRRKVGLPGLIQFLRSNGTVGELATRASEMMGIPYSEAKSMFGDVLVEFPTYGFGIMGPKLGMFAASNAGMPDALVLDRWMQRLNGRIAGNMFLRRSEESMRQIRERMESAWEAFSGKATGKKLIESLGIPVVSDVGQIAKKVERLAEDPEIRELLSRTKAGDELRRASNLFVQAYSGELIEVPRNGRERYNMLLSYRRVADRVGMTIPEVQATAWYGEKELYWAMGTNRYTESADYYAAARAWYKDQYNEDIPLDQRFVIGNIGRLLKKHGVKHHFSTHQDREPMFQSQYVYDINRDGDYELRPTVGYADEALRLAYSLGVKALPEDREATIPNMAASLWERALIEGDPSLALAAEIMINESKDPRRVRAQAGNVASEAVRPYLLWEQPYEPLERLVNATRHVISPYSLLLAMNGPVVDDGWVVVLRPRDIRAAAFAALEAADAENIDVSKVNVVVLTPEPKLYVDVPIESARDGTVEGGKEFFLDPSSSVGYQLQPSPKSLEIDAVKAREPGDSSQWHEWDYVPEQASKQFYKPDALDDETIEKIDSQYRKWAERAGITPADLTYHLRANKGGVVYRPYGTDDFVVGRFVGRTFVASHFAPQTMKGGVDVLTDLLHIDTPVVFAVPETLADQLERIGYRRGQIIVPMFFRGNVVYKHILANNAVSSRDLRDLAAYWLEEAERSGLLNMLASEGRPIGSLPVGESDILPQSSALKERSEIETPTDAQEIGFQPSTIDERREIERLSQQADEYIRTLGYLPSKKPGVPSRLTKHQWVQVRSTNFKKWFGDWENDPNNASKVVDSTTGEPLVLTKLPSFVAGRMHTMPYKFIQEIESWDYVSRSPYSYSFYNMPGKTWDHTPEGIIRISDHWNFISRGQMHAVTDVQVPNETHWTKARYENGVWRVLEVLPAETTRRSNLIRGLDQIDDLNKAAEASSDRRAKLTLRTWERSRGRFRLVDERTVEGRVIKKTPHMVTIMTDDGVIYRGKNYVLSELPYEKQAKFYLNDKTGEIKSADLNVGTFGQRVPTDEEAAQFGMAPEQAAEAQARGDIRFQKQRSLAGYASAPETIKQVQRDEPKSAWRRFSEYALLSLDTQAKMIGGDTLRASLREMIDREELYNSKYKPIVEEFEKNIKKLSKKEHNAVWLALYNGDWSVAEQIFRDNRRTQNYTLARLREMLNEIHSRAADVGMEIGYIENYFPRTVRSYKELAKHFSSLLGTIAESDIYMAVNEFVKKEGRPPTTQELAKLVRLLIEGRYRSGASLPSYVKSRKLPELDFAMLKYYEKPSDSLVIYVRLMNNSISRREWLGRMSDAIAKQNPYASLSYRKALADYRRALIYYDMLLDDPNASPNDIQRAAESVEQLRALTSLNSGVSMVLADMVKSGLIPVEKHNDALRLLQWALAPETKNRFFDGLRALGNALGLGSWITALRNIGDVSVSFVSQGLGPTARAILGGGPIRWKDLGYERLQADIDAETAGWSDRIQNAYLTIGGTTAVSRYGQRVLANAAAIRARSLAKRYLKGSAQAGRKLAFLVEKAFTSGLTPELAVRLMDKKVNESIVQMGRWAVSQVQAVDTLAMPQLYREHPIARFVYQWRNWLLRYYNFMYADGILEIAQGIRAKNPQQVWYGLRNVAATLPAAWLVQVLMTMVINSILGRDDEPDEIAEQELWNLLFFNRYQQHLIEQGRLREAMWSMIAPSIGLVGTLEKDVRLLIRRGGDLNSPWELRILRNLTPGVGRIIDAHHPAGSGEARRQANPADYRRVKEELERRDIPASLVPEMRKLSALSRQVEEARDIGDYEAAERLAAQLRMAAQLTRRSMTEQRLKRLEQRARALEEKERRKERIARALAAQRN